MLHMVSLTVSTAVYDPDVRPNWSVIPGMTQLKELVSGAMAIGLLLCVLALILSAIVWAVGSISGRASMGSGGKTGVIVSIIAAIVIGAASTLIGWGGKTGQNVSAPPAMEISAPASAAGGDIVGF